MRYAIFFIPDPDSEFARLGMRWLGRDIESGTRFPSPAARNLSAAKHDALVAEPRRYGFHGTLKAPFRLARGWRREDLLASFRRFAREATPVRIPVLSLVRMRRFFALAPAGNDPELEMLGADAEYHFEPLRAPLSPKEEARRSPPGLTERQRALLARYGYPYVLDEFRFHLTLTGPVKEADAAAVREALETAFQPVIGRSVTVDRVALAVQTAPDSDLSVLAVAPIGDPLAHTWRAMRLEIFGDPYTPPIVWPRLPGREG